MLHSHNNVEQANHLYNTSRASRVQDTLLRAIVWRYCVTWREFGQGNLGMNDQDVESLIYLLES